MSLTPSPRRRELRRALQVADARDSRSLEQVAPVFVLGELCRVGYFEVSGCRFDRHNVVA